MIQFSIQELFQSAIRLHKTGQIDASEHLFSQVLDQEPHHVGAHYGLGLIRQARGHYLEAAGLFQRAVELNPSLAVLHCWLGHARHALGDLDSAITCYREALQRDQKCAPALNGLALALKEVGLPDEALSCHQQAVRLEPGNPVLHSMMIFTLQSHPKSNSEILRDESRRWNDRFARVTGPCPPHTNDRNPSRNLRIGYVSGDFNAHTSIFFILPLFKNHDPHAVEIICYAQGKDDDLCSQQLRMFCKGWRSTTALSDDRLAEIIRGDQIDILVDLKLHTGQNRLLTFARKPAPIQVTWLGYPGTSGLDAMDYRLTDPYLDPPGEHDTWYCEESLRLPHTFWCYSPLITDPPEVNPLPALASDKRVITFGNINNSYKIHDGVLMAWAQVLNAVPNSRLILLLPPPSFQMRIVEKMKCEGITPERITFERRRPHGEYLQLYHQIDIGLDTFPCNGHTTSLDSFWMGVPVVTLVGPTVIGRAGYSQLMNLGLPQLAACTTDDYVQIALKLASDLPYLGSLRAGLRKRMEESPLMDAPRFARDMEAAYRVMWQRWCAGESPRRP